MQNDPPTIKHKRVSSTKRFQSLPRSLQCPCMLVEKCTIDELIETFSMAAEKKLKVELKDSKSREAIGLI